MLPDNLFKHWIEIGADLKKVTIFGPDKPSNCTQNHEINRCHFTSKFLTSYICI
jgi:hypothetical protein